MGFYERLEFMHDHRLSQSNGASRFRTPRPEPDRPLADAARPSFLGSVSHLRAYRLLRPFRWF